MQREMVDWTLEVKGEGQVDWQVLL